MHMSMSDLHTPVADAPTSVTLQCAYMWTNRLSAS
jgi:hypothetical protein